MRIWIYVMFVWAISTACNPVSDLAFIDLEVKYNHFESAVPQVFFSWKTLSNKKGFIQSGYEIIVYEAQHGSNILWRSEGKNTRKQYGIKYTGKKLNPGTKYTWKVRVKDSSNKWSVWSNEVSFFYLDEFSKHSNAKWISFQYEKAHALPVFGKAFSTNKMEDISSVQLLVSGLGYYEVLLNGKKVGDHMLDPAQTNYDDYAFYVHYQINKDEIKQHNELKILLGDGFYDQNLVWSPTMSYGKPKVVASLQINRRDGSKQIINTDETWFWTNGPVIKSNIYAGEHYDANKDSVLTAPINKMQWNNVKIAEHYPPKVIPQTMDPIRITDTLSVKKIFQKGSKCIFDFGQNFAGVVELKMSASAGTKVTLRYGEALYKDSTLDTRSTGVFATKQEQIDSYICRGGSNEKWHPRFTYHGFRYVEVEGIENPAQDMLLGMVIHSDLSPTGTFSCSSETINRLHQMNQWTLKSNLYGIPTDCPQREKCGWLGDAHVMTLTMMQNYDSHLFLKKYLYDIKSSAQKSARSLVFKTNFHDRDIELKPAGIPFMIAPGKRKSGTASIDWGTAVMQIPWYLYVYYGDKDVLRDFYPMMKQWVEYVHVQSDEGIIKYGLGDWCPPGAHAARDCPISISSTAFHYMDIDILEKTAGLLDKLDDKRLYATIKQEVKQKFNQHFFNQNSKSYGSQTANALALDLGLVATHQEKEVSNAIVENIVNQYDGFIHTGMFGLGRIFDALSNYGNQEMASNIFNKTGYNSFPYMWEHYDATTMWEVLPVDDYFDNPEKNDHKRTLNHSIHISTDSWFYRRIAGISPLEEAPGFEKIKLKPGMFNYLKYAKATYQSPYGEIASNWVRKDGFFNWFISIPDNSSGDIYVPVFKSNGLIQVNEQSIEFNNISVSKDGNRYVLLENQLSGEYNICSDF